MNLPITTLEEAWGSQKISNIENIANKYKKESTQFDLLNNLNTLKPNNAYNMDTKFYHNEIPNIYENKIMTPFNSNVNNKSDDYIQLFITDSDIIDYFSKFDEQYRNNLISNILRKHINNPKKEMYNSNSNNTNDYLNNECEIFIVVAFLIFILIEKIYSLVYT